MEINTVNTAMPMVREMTTGASDAGHGRAQVALDPAFAPTRVASSPQATTGSLATNGTGADVPSAEQKGNTARQAALKVAMDAATQSIQQLSPSLEFQVDPETKQTVVRVVDTTNNEVIKQIPSAEFLRVSNAIEGLQKHLLDEKA
jgi:flagellar protein FlaG